MPPTGTVSPHDQHGVRQDQATGLPVPARPRLAARLDRFAELMVLQAPPGFGKTTVLDRWVAGRERDGLATRSYRGTAWQPADLVELTGDRKSTRLNSSHVAISYAVFCLKKR